MQRGYFPKGASTYWECDLHVGFEPLYRPRLKRPEKGISVQIMVVDFTCYITLSGVMGLHTFVSDS